MKSYKKKYVFLFIFLLVVITMSYSAEQYIQDVLNEKIITCKWVKLAVRRHVNDLKKAEDDNFPYYFDNRHAERVIDFIQLLNHVEGEWANKKLNPDTRLKLEPFQQFKIWVIFGWRKRTDGTRRFTKAYIEMARKNGKTILAADMAIYCAYMDRPKEEGAQVYFTATKKSSAKIGWNMASKQIRKNKYLNNKSRIYRTDSTVVIYDSNSVIKPFGRDSDEDGFNPSVVVIDEYHLHKTNEMIEVMESGMGARLQPLEIIITTAGTDKNSPCFKEEHSMAEQILEGSLKPVPENFFAIIFTLDAEDDWHDESCWIKANPNIGVSVKWDYLRDRVLSAKQMPSKANLIITKNFNKWTQVETRWILDDDWMKCDFPVDPEKLNGRKCFLGMDLSSSIDITALVACFPPVENENLYQLLFWFFMPEENIIERERRDKVPYASWVNDDLIITTPGNVIDYNFIEQEILSIGQKYEIVEIPHDPWKAQEIINNLSNEGFQMVPMYQRYSAMAAPTDTFQKKVLKKEIAHGGNDIARWMMACTEVKTDRQGNQMPMKPQRDKSGKRIDGIVASIMALGRAVIVQDDDAGLEVYAG